MTEDLRNENFVRKVIEEHQGSNLGSALDIGANHGLYTDLLASKFKLVYAFEPDPNNIKILKQRSTAPNVNFIEYAVDVRDGGMIKLYRSDDPGGSSTNEESPRFGGWGHRWDNYIWVPTITLDCFWQDHKATSMLRVPSSEINFIKCDIEGAEDYVFESGKNLLRENRLTMVLECHQPVNFERLFNLFTGLGYKVFDMEGNQTDHLRRDAHFVIRNDL